MDDGWTCVPEARARGQDGPGGACGLALRSGTAGLEQSALIRLSKAKTPNRWEKHGVHVDRGTDVSQCKTLIVTLGNVDKGRPTSVLGGRFTTFCSAGGETHIARCLPALIGNIIF
eukprot:1185829-Prorocentrum_minimum.AAC.8